MHILRNLGSSHVAGFLLVLSLSLFGCKAPKPTISIQGQTDLVPGVEFTNGDVTLYTLDSSGGVVDAIGNPRHFNATSQSNWGTGHALTAFANISPQNVLVRVRLLDDNSTVVAHREIQFTVAGSATIVAVLSRNCLNLSCAAHAGTTCDNGECVPVTCFSGAPENCLPSTCSADGDCASNAPSMFQCAGSVCTSEGFCIHPPLTGSACTTSGACCTGDNWCDPGHGCTAIPVMDAGVDAGDDAGDGGDSGLTDGQVSGDAMPDMIVADMTGHDMTTDGPDGGPVDMGSMDMATMDMTIRDLGPDAHPDMMTSGDSGIGDMAIDMCRYDPTAFGGPACVPDEPCTDIGDSHKYCNIGRRDCCTGSCVPVEGMFLPTGSNCGGPYSGAVCDSTHACVDCHGGAACNRPPSCRQGTISCEMGNVCVPNSGGALVPTGTKCGDNAYCDSSGNCSTCNVGQACVPFSNPCLSGTFNYDRLLGECVCEAGGAVDSVQCSLGAGSGTGFCSGGTCEACVSNVDCISDPNACVFGRTMCDVSGNSTCAASTGSVTNRTAGTLVTCSGSTDSCVCDGMGNQVACQPGASCNVSHECAVSTYKCNTGAAVCSPDSIALAGTGCRVSSQVCNGTQSDCQETFEFVNSIGLGPKYGCAIVGTARSTNGVVYCWGSQDGKCQIGNSPTVDAGVIVPQPVPVDFSSTTANVLQQVVVGDSTACALDTSNPDGSGNVYCWGNGVGGELGTLALPTSAQCASAGRIASRAVQVRALNQVMSDSYLDPLHFVQIAISSAPPVNCDTTACADIAKYKVCGVTTDGDVYCWGGGADITGYATMVWDHTDPLHFYQPWAARQVAVGDGHWCVLASAPAPSTDTNIFCFGRVGAGQRGDGLGFTGGGSGYAGDNDMSNTHVPPATNLTAVRNPGNTGPLTNATAIAASGTYTCASYGSGITQQVACWGSGAGVAGATCANTGCNIPQIVTTDGTHPLSGVIPVTPDPVHTGLVAVTGLAAGGGAACAHTLGSSMSANRVYCWGSSYLGNQNYLEGGSSFAVPVAVNQPDAGVAPAPFDDLVRVAVGFGVKTSGGSVRTTIGCVVRDGPKRQLYCWGANGDNQLDDGTVTFHNTPVPALPIAAPTVP